MNISTIFYVWLFVPFVILFIIFGATFMTAGYKKDLGRSLISLGASVAAVIVSLALSKLLAWGLSFALKNALMKLIPADGGMLTAVAGGAAQGVINIVLALLFFGIFFPIALGVLKTVFVKHIRVDKLNLGTNGSKWGGLGVRFVDALLVVLMLSLPLYGTIATVIPPVSSILQIAAPEQYNQDTVTPTSSVKQGGMGITNMDTATVQAENGLEDYISDDEIYMPDRQQSSASLASNYIRVIKTIEKHPILIPYKYGPADWVYSGLSSFSMNGKSVDIARAAKVMSELTDRFITFTQVIDSEDKEQVRLATEDIVSYARDNVIEERWFYNMCMALLGEFDKAVAENAVMLDGNAMTIISQLRPLFDMSYKEFKSNGVAILDFFEYLLDESVIGMLYKGGNSSMPTDKTALIDELLTRLGALINHSEQAVAAKQLIYSSFITSYGIQNTAPYFEKNWGNGMLTEADAQKRDAAMFWTIITGVDEFKFLQLMAMNPLFGGETAAKLLYCDEIIYEMGWLLYDYTDEYNVRELIKNDSSLFEDFKAKLISYEQLPVSESYYYGGKNNFERYIAETLADKLGIKLDNSEYNYDSFDTYNKPNLGNDSSVTLVDPSF